MATRQETENGSAVMRFGPFTVDGQSGELHKGSTRLKVPDQSIAVLQALLERPGELVTREALRARLWAPDTFVDFEAGLNAAVRRLREALNDSADTPRYVETLPRRGYRFIAPIDGATINPTGCASAPTIADGSAGLVSSVSVRSTVAVRRFRGVGAGLAILAVVVMGAALSFGPRNNRAPVFGRPVPLTSFPGLELDPAIAPAGNFVAFAWEGEGGDNFDIYVQAIDGGRPVPLTTDGADDHAPMWSPDGQRIVFERDLNGTRVIFSVSVLGGDERQLFKAGAECDGWRFGAWACGLSWTPDGQHLVFGAQSSSSYLSSSAIYLYSLKDGTKRQLTRPPANLSDIHPMVSPDGRYLGFVRLNPRSRGGNVFVQQLEQLQVVGEPRQLTLDRAVNAFDWTPDSRSVIHDAGPVEPGLWRVGVNGASEPLLSNIRAFRPSVARSGARVVYQNMLIDSNIWEMPTPASPTHRPSGDVAFRVIASTAGDSDMQFSPDGTRIVFCSDRSGHGELWVANRDGSRATQLTHFEGGGRVGSPSWSADGKRIAFDATLTGTSSWNIHVVPADGGPVVARTAGDSNNIRPSWSPDGRWIYFGSRRTGDWQIWRLPSTGGTPEPITHHGGLEPIVSPDGRIYYAKAAPEPGIWEVRGGEEVQIIPRGRQLSFDVAENGIFMMDASAKPQVTVEMFSFASRRIIPVAWLPPGVQPSYFTVARDGRSMLYSQLDSRMSDIELLRESR